MFEHCRVLYLQATTAGLCNHLFSHFNLTIKFIFLDVLLWKCDSEFLRRGHLQNGNKWRRHGKLYFWGRGPSAETRAPFFAMGIRVRNNPGMQMVKSSL